jgi:nicotinamide mononucleotide transporter
VAVIEQYRLEEISVAFALVYVALAIRQSPWCWPAALISAALMAVVVLDTRLYFQAALQIFYLAMAIYGWQQWQSGGDRGKGVRVHRWPLTRHALVLAFIAVASLLAWLALRRTADAMLFLDSLTSIASVVTTFMVTRKLIENWIYWFVIDAVLVYVFLARGLIWIAGLYAVYLVMVIFGFRAWQKSLREESAHSDARLAH